MITGLLQQDIDLIIQDLGTKNLVIVKKFYIGKNVKLEAALVYISGLVNKDIIDRDLLAPLMSSGVEDRSDKAEFADHLCMMHITASSAAIEKDEKRIIELLKKGYSTILINGCSEAIAAETSGGMHREISDPPNETSIRGTREGFVENLETNISILNRKIKDKNLKVESFSVGRRSQTSLALVYIDDIVDKAILEEVKKRITSIDVDSVTGTGMIDQFIEKSTYTIFPQIFGTERTDRVAANLMEGRIALILSGTPFVLTLPSVMAEFFHTVEDYYERTVVANIMRFLRLIATFIVIMLPATYLTLLKFNVELIPIDFIIPIVQSRTGIPFTPFMEILTLEVLVEFLREGGLRLPSKIAQTLSIVGGIIVGDAAVNSRIVSHTTLLIVGITVIASFLIPNYEMSFSIRMLRFPMLLMANVMGVFGVAAGIFWLMVHLSSLDSFGVPYFTFYKNDLKDILFRAPLWQMNSRLEGIPNNDPIRQTDFRKKLRGKKDEQ